MSLRQNIENKMKEALRSKDTETLSLFRLLLNSIKNTEIERKQELTDEEVITVLEKEAKQRRDSITEYEKGNRQDLADKEKKELEVIESFLPEKMTEEEIRSIVKEKIASMPEANFGQAMGLIMSELKGKADGGLVQRVVKKELGL